MSCYIVSCSKITTKLCSSFFDIFFTTSVHVTSPLVFPLLSTNFPNCKPNVKAWMDPSTQPKFLHPLHSFNKMYNHLRNLHSIASNGHIDSF